MSVARRSGRGRPVEILVIGAGVAGLAAAYGFTKVPGVHLRVVEKRRGKFHTIHGPCLSICADDQKRSAWKEDTLCTFLG